MDELERIKQKKLKEIMDRAQLFKEWPSSPLLMTDDNFNALIQKYPIVVVDCWAEWCAPCKIVAPVIDALAGEYKGKILFSKLNVDENPIISRGFRVVSIPTFLVFKHGKLVDRLVGALPRNVLEQRITAHL